MFLISLMISHITKKSIVVHIPISKFSKVLKDILIFKVFVLMQFDPGMEYRPDYRAPGFGMQTKLSGGMMGGGMPPGVLPPGGGNLMGHNMGGMHNRSGGTIPGILPPPSQQVEREIL